MRNRRFDRLISFEQKTWQRDLAVHWEAGRRYWVDMWWNSVDAGVVARVWDKGGPIARGVVPRGKVVPIVTGRYAEVLMSFLKRAAEADATKRVVASKSADAWMKAHPALGEYLTATSYPDGGQRKTATLLLFWEDGIWKGCLRDRDTNRSLWVSAGSPAEVYADLESVLKSDAAEWRKDTPYQPGRKK